MVAQVSGFLSLTRVWGDLDGTMSSGLWPKPAWDGESIWGVSQQVERKIPVVSLPFQEVKFIAVMFTCLWAVCTSWTRAEPMNMLASLEVDMKKSCPSSSPWVGGDAFQTQGISQPLSSVV